MRGIAGEFDALDFAAESREAEIASMLTTTERIIRSFESSSVVVGHARYCRALALSRALVKWRAPRRREHHRAPGIL